MEPAGGLCELFVFLLSSQVCLDIVGYRGKPFEELNFACQIGHMPAVCATQ